MAKGSNEVERDATVEAYKAAKGEFDLQLEKMRVDVEAVRIESQAIGVFKTLQATTAYGELLKAITLHGIKQSKEYKAGGMTWVEFCESQGFEARTVDRMLSDLKPVLDNFSDSVVRFSGMPFNKIKLLGRQISGQLSEIQDGCLVYGDESIPLTPEYHDDIQALIERISEEAKEKVEESEAQISAKDKVLKSKQDLLNKQERILKKYEKEAAVMGITPEEDSYIQQINGLKMGFDGYLLRLEKNIVPEDYETFTPRMKAALISAAHYMQMQILALYETITTEHGNPTMNPELLAGFDVWEKEQQT